MPDKKIFDQSVKTVGLFEYVAYIANNIFTYIYQDGKCQEEPPLYRSCLSDKNIFDQSVKTSTCWIV